jgi:hypothetical protein
MHAHAENSSLVLSYKHRIDTVVVTVVQSPQGGTIQNKKKKCFEEHHNLQVLQILVGGVRHCVVCCPPCVPVANSVAIWHAKHFNSPLHVYCCSQATMPMTRTAAPMSGLLLLVVAAMAVLAAATPEVTPGPPMSGQIKQGVRSSGTQVNTRSSGKSTACLRVHCRTTLQCNML